MDVQKWLSETTPPRVDDPPPSLREKRKRKRHQQPASRKRQLASEDREEVASVRSSDHGNRGPPRKKRQFKQTHESVHRRRVQLPGATAITAPSRRNEVSAGLSRSLTSGAVEDGSSDRSTSVSATLILRELTPVRSQPKYERRARHKTRSDRYELKDGKQSKSRKQRSSGERRRGPRKSIPRRGKTSEALVHNFSASNVAQDRLTVSTHWNTTSSCALQVPPSATILQSSDVDRHPIS